MRVRLGRPPQVHEGDGAVAERVRRAPTTLRLPPRVGPPRQRLPGRPQAGHHLDEVAGPILGSFLEAADQDVRHGLRHRGAPAGREAISPIVVQHRGRREAVLPGAPTEERLEHAEAEGPQVGATVEGQPGGVLGREVGRGAAPAPCGRHRASGGIARPLGGRGPHRAGPSQPEVGDLREPVGGQHHVRRLHVPVHEALRVRVVQPPGQLDRDVEDALRGVQAAGADRVVQAAPVDVLREDERGPGEAADVVARDHVRVEAEVHPRLRLALEQLRAVRRVQRGRERHLDREVEVPPPVAHAVDAAHAALAEDAPRPRTAPARPRPAARRCRRSPAGPRGGPPRPGWAASSSATVGSGRLGLRHGGLGYGLVGNRRSGLDEGSLAGAGRSRRSVRRSGGSARCARRGAWARDRRPRRRPGTAPSGNRSRPWR